MIFFFNSHLGLLGSDLFDFAIFHILLYRHSTSTTSKGHSENLKKMSWDNPVSPIDAKNSIVFFVAFFWG